VTGYLDPESMSMHPLLNSKRTTHAARRLLVPGEREIDEYIQSLLTSNATSLIHCQSSFLVETRPTSNLSIDTHWAARAAPSGQSNRRKLG
jgi:hypothetical protein